MDRFCETHHAYLIASFFRAFVAQDGVRGETAFVKAAQIYGEERGRRMALRALRDGCALDLAAYFAYSEWAPTSEDSATSFLLSPGRVEEHIMRCPWADVFLEVAPDCARLYCREIDRALLRGFSPELGFESVQILAQAPDCRMRFFDETADADFWQRVEAVRRKACDRVRPFSYHCGHVWFTFSRVARNIFGRQAGMEIAAAAYNAFAQRFGEAMARALTGYADDAFLSVENDGRKTAENGEIQAVF